MYYCRAYASQVLFPCYPCKKPIEAGVLQMRKPRTKKVKEIIQGHLASRWQIRAHTQAVWLPDILPLCQKAVRNPLKFVTD